VLTRPQEPTNEVVGMASDDAAGEAGPPDETDGAATAVPMTRRDRARRRVIGSVVAVAVLALVAAGVLAASGKQVVPAGWWPFSGVPAGWTEVSGAGLTLAVPPGFELSEGMGYGSVWGAGPDGEAFGTDSMVVVMPSLDEESLSAGAYGTVVQAEVPGAASAEYARKAVSGGDGLEGALDVELKSGTTVRLMVLLTEAHEPERTFERLVGTVAVDPAFDESELSMPESEQRRLDVIQELPSGWKVREYRGLKFAAPGDWAEHDSGRNADAPALSMDDEAGMARLEVTAVPSTLDPDGEFGYTYLFDPPPGADRAGVELDSESESFNAWIEVRKAGGRTYSIELRVPDGAEGERMVRAFAGNLEFTAEADDLPSYEDLTDAQPFVDDAPEIPGDWVVADGGRFRLRVPPDWADPGATSEGEILLSSPSGESVSAYLVEPGVTGIGEIPITGYRLDIPGAERTAVRRGDHSASGEPDTFIAHADVGLADGWYLLVRYDGPAGPESEERFWQLLSTLELDD
jgi:hypothetical protein